MTDSLRRRIEKLELHPVGEAAIREGLRLHFEQHQQHPSTRVRVVMTRYIEMIEGMDASMVEGEPLP
jgi:hypothetical protein